MSDIGPELPPHLLAKRKRQQEAKVPDGPLGASGAKRSGSEDESEKRRKVMGPAMPPALLEQIPEQPLHNQSDEESDDDEDFGPTLPGDGENNDDQHHDLPLEHDEKGAEASSKKQRDEWMMMPPEQDDLAARLDPTRRRPTTFNTGKGAKAPNTAAGDSSSWHETPAQRQKRLADEMMGITKPSGPAWAEPGKAAKASKKDDSASRKTTVDPARGPSLLEQHKQSKGAEAEDDPSKRAFDREKDMRSGTVISDTTKKHLLQKGSDLSSKFSSGGLL